MLQMFVQSALECAAHLISSERFGLASGLLFLVAGLQLNEYLIICCYH